jgi:hypothetical protein
MSMTEACDRSLSTGLTAIIPTYSCNPKTFALSLLSLLHWSSKSLEHVIIAINGPDSRNGDTKNQDAKQAFLETLCNEKIRNKNMPLTIMRTWSRLGHGESVDAALSWVHTKNYLLIHDDVFILNNRLEQINHILEDEKVGWIFADKQLVISSPQSVHSLQNNCNLNGVTFPHPTTHFIALRKRDTIDVKWSGYFVMKENFPKSINLKNLPVNNPDFLSYDIGAFVFQHLISKYSKAVQIKGNTYHYVAASWSKKRKNQKEQEIFTHVVKTTERLIMENHPQLFKIYIKFFKDYDDSPQAHK